MIVDEPLLRAYVDGELDPVTREQVEAVLANNTELQAQAQALRASCLPYRMAFEAQALPLPPAALLRQVAALSAVAAAPARAEPQAVSNDPRHTGPGRRRWLGFGAALAASFGGGMIVPWRPAPLSTQGADSSPWVRAIASYHALYVRETVDQPGDAPARIKALLAGFSPAQQAQLYVRNLEPAGLAFKRVQRLGYGDVPLIQMVYLAAQGRPAALCVLPVQRPDAPVQVQRLEGLGVATWTQGGLAHVLVADLPADDTLSLARRVAAGGFAKA
jgi:anti-sigma factor RsiW